MSGSHTEEIDLSQHHIKSKIRQYLRQKGRSHAFIKEFNNGYCHGLAVLAAYGQYLTSQPTAATPCDNWEWFLRVITMLARWNRHTSILSAQEEQDIDRFIGLIHFFQNAHDYLPYAQGSLDNYLSDTAKRNLHQEYTFAGLLRAGDFTKPITLDAGGSTTLLDELLKYNQRLILVSCGRHTLSLFRNNNQITLYDSNHVNGLQVFNKNNPDALVNALFQAYQYDAAQPSPLGFRLFTFERPGSYLRAQHILDQLQTPLAFDYPGNRKKYTALHIAARVGSTDCVSYFLAHGADLAAEDNNGQTPRRIAKGRHYTEIAKLLLQPPRRKPVNDPIFTCQNVLFFSSTTRDKQTITENKHNKIP